MTFTWQQLVQAWAVEIIRRLWDEGKYRDNKWLRMIHDNWIGVWIDWKTDLTMRSVDQQAEELVELWEADEDPAIDAFEYSERLEGDTPLGGEMRLRAPFMDETP